MEGFTIKIGVAIGVVLLIVLLWVVWKFFSKLFKHVIIMLVIGFAGSAFYYYRTLPPSLPSYVGKHAYMKANGEYIGVVEGQGSDKQRGPVWIVRPLGSSPLKYAKSRVLLKDTMELKSAPTSTPAPESKPDADKKVDKNADKVDKKKKT